MPTVKLTSVTVAHIWDDGSVTSFKITAGQGGELGQYVSLESEESAISLRHESWPEIRDQIDAMFAEVEE